MSLNSIQRVRVCAAVVSVVSGLSPFVAGAQTTQPDEAALEKHLTVQGLEFNFMPGVWMPRVSGHSTFGPSSTATELDNRQNLNLDDSQAVFNLDVSVRKAETWQLMGGGFAFSTDGHGTFDGSANFGGLALSTGDDFSSSFDMSSFNLEIGYWLNVVDGPGYTHLMVAPVLGFRYIDISVDVTETGVGEAEADGDWACPYVGGAMEIRWDSRSLLKFIDQVQLAGGVGGGPAVGGDGGWMGQVHVELSLTFTRNLGMFFGYKLVDIDAENDDFEFSGGLEGLYFGGILRF
jgi:hypothetical protein